MDWNAYVDFLPIDVTHFTCAYWQLTCCLFRSWAATNSPIWLPWMNCTLARTTWTLSRNGCSRTWPRSRNSTCSRTISVNWTPRASSGWKTFPRCFSIITCWDSSTTNCSSRWQIWKNCTYYTIIVDTLISYIPENPTPNDKNYKNQNFLGK